jgi:hypothetical protein
VKVGDSVTTLPTTRPKEYANVSGVIATRNGEEYGVLVKGRVVWFLEREIANERQASNQEVGAKPTGQEVRQSQARASSSGPSPRGNGAGVMSPPVTSQSSDRPLSGDPGAVDASGAGSSPTAVSSPSRPAQSLAHLLIGARGPGGGMVAICTSCGRKWERERKRGRPASLCVGCRTVTT